MNQPSTTNATACMHGCSRLKSTTRLMLLQSTMKSRKPLLNFPVVKLLDQLPFPLNYIYKAGGPPLIEKLTRLFQSFRA